MDGVLVLMFFEVLRDLVRQYRPHVIVTTYPLYQAPLGVLFALTRWRAPLITVVTDLVSVHRLWFSDAVDLCLVPTEAARELATKVSVAPGKVRVTGIPVDPAIGEETRPKGVIRDELGWREDLSTILVVGSKRVANLWNVVQALNHARLGVQIVAVAGGDDELFERFQRTTWHAEAHIYNFTTNLPTMMHAADLMVCKAGGLTVSEALASGLPMLFIGVSPGQEAGNAEYVVQAGAGKVANDPPAVLESVRHWLDDEGAELAKRQQAARALGRPSAAYVTAELVWSLAEKAPREGPSRDTSRRIILKQWLDQHGISWRERLSK